MSDKSVATTAPTAGKAMAGLDMNVQTSLDLKTKEGRTLFVKCQQEECGSIDEYINKEISVRDVLTHDTESVNDDTGEVERWTRVVLFLSNGDIVACGSAGVLKSLRLAQVLFGPPPWINAIGTVNQQQLSAQRRWVTIQWKTDEIPIKAKHGK